jgi:hypothetical protein
MYCDLRDINADLLTVSAHKIHPPRSFILRPTLKSGNGGSLDKLSPGVLSVSDPNELMS